MTNILLLVGAGLFSRGVGGLQSFEFNKLCVRACSVSVVRLFRSFLPDSFVYVLLDLLCTPSKHPVFGPSHIVIPIPTTHLSYWTFLSIPLLLSLSLIR